MNGPKILKLYRGTIERGLAEALQDPAVGGGPSPLYPTLRYHVGLCDEDGNEVKALGKMLRPSLLLFTAHELGGEVDKALPAAVALELVHNFSLVHDDIQDQDEIRRGRPTVWKLIGVAQAINAGDLMYSIAIENALQSGADAALSIVTAARAMIEGQGLDLAFEERWVDTRSYIDMIDKKTGALIRCAFRTAGIIADAREETVAVLSSLGEELGRAFQIRDDLLGVWGNGDVTGKPKGSDIRRKKKSYPVALAMQQADEEGRSILESVYEQEKISDGDVERVIELMDSLNVKESGEEAVEEHLKISREYLDRLPISEEGRGMMNELIMYLARREK